MSFFSASFVTGFLLCHCLPLAALLPTLSLFVISASASGLCCCLTALSPSLVIFFYPFSSPLCSWTLSANLRKPFPTNSHLISLQLFNTLGCFCSQVFRGWLWTSNTLRKMVLLNLKTRTCRDLSLYKRRFILPLVKCSHPRVYFLFT